MGHRDDGRTLAPQGRPRWQRIALAVLVAAVVSAIVGGVWSLAGLPGGPGPVFGIVFASLLVFGGGLSAATTAAVGAVRGAARRKIEARFPRGDYERATDMANNFGVTSKGPAQLRGNGALVLTHETLLFMPLVGDEIAIPRGGIRSTSIVRAHLGKTVGRPLLKIDYDDDSIAFYVDDPESWAESLLPGTSARH
jgi:hypothetical protein